MVASQRLADAPPAWVRLCVGVFGTSTRLAKQLWSAYCALFPGRAHTVTYQLALTGHLPRDLPPWVVAQRLAQLEEVLRPHDLLAASLRLSPEGKQRRRDVIQFESAVLDYVNKNGWK